MSGKFSKLSPILEDFIRKIAENQVTYANLFRRLYLMDGIHFLIYLTEFHYGYSQNQKINRIS